MAGKQDAGNKHIFGNHQQQQEITMNTQKNSLHILLSSSKNINLIPVIIVCPISWIYILFITEYLERIAHSYRYMYVSEFIYKQLTFLCLYNPHVPEMYHKILLSVFRVPNMPYKKAN